MPLSDPFIRDIFADESDDPLLVLLTIEHPGLPEPFRIVNDTQDLISRGMTFFAWPFEFLPPEQADGPLTPPSVRIDNVHRDLVQGLRSLQDAPTCKAEIILASSPSVVEQEFPIWEMRSVSYNNQTLTANLTPPDDETEPVVSKRFTPDYSPGIFRA